MEALISIVTKSSNIYFINKKKAEEMKYYKRSSYEVKECHSDVMSVSDGYEDDQQPFLSHYSLTSRSIFIYLYHMGMFYFFDFEYQVESIDQEYKNTTR